MCLSSSTSFLWLEASFWFFQFSEAIYNISSWHSRLHYFNEIHRGHTLFQFFQFSKDIHYCLWFFSSKFIKWTYTIVSDFFIETHQISYTIVSGFFSLARHTRFHRNSSNGCIQLPLYVDDLIIIDKSSWHSRLQQFRPAKFGLKDLGFLWYFLGIDVSPSPKGFFLTQQEYNQGII